jgi:hypothetical protein
MIEIQLEKLTRFIRNHQSVAIFRPGVTENQILEVELEIETEIPPEYKEFLLSFNGGFISIFKKRTDPDWNEKDSAWASNEFLGLGQIKEIFFYKRQVYRDRKWNGPWPYIPFCKTYEPEYLMFSLPRGEAARAILDAFHENMPFDWPTVYPSFAALLDAYIDGFGDIKTVPTSE